MGGGLPPPPFMGGGLPPPPFMGGGLPPPPNGKFVIPKKVKIVEKSKT